MEVVTSDAQIDAPFADPPSIPGGIDAILGPGGYASRVIPGWESRPAQLEMSKIILGRLVGGGAAVIEAPTGVGKTFAYLVAAVLSGRRVVISTNTKTLQDQIIDKDLPQLEAILRDASVDLVRATAEDEIVPPPATVRYALMKGRSNYLCLDRLDRQLTQLSFGFDRNQFQDIADWAEGTERGDRAELSGLADDASLWSKLDARSDICTGTRCARYQDCFVVRMRREAQNASIIIVNHHLLMADVAMRARSALSGSDRTFGAVIPETELLIVDEAHALDTVASEYFGGKYTSGQVDRLLRDVRAFAEEPRALVDLTGLRASVGSVEKAAKGLFGAVPRREGRSRAGRDGPQVFAAARAARPPFDAALHQMAGRLSQHETEPRAENLQNRAEDLRAGIRFVLEAEDPDYVYWTEREGARSAVGASPINVSHLLRQFLFDTKEAVALTSATLASGKDCSYFRSAVGAPAESDELILQSPFVYEEQAAVFLPHDAPDPTSDDAVERVAKIGRQVIETIDGGVLFLFTSYRMLNAVHEVYREQLSRPLLVQGAQPKRALLEAFVDQAPAVLLGTASFWEGVDVPGTALSAVVIDKLPFDSPADPLIAARAERLTDEGRSAFFELQLPRAILRLKQGFGRLVRRRTDRGVVAILDRRVQKRPYGRRFLQALPDAPKVRSIASLEEWWRSGSV